MAQVVLILGSDDIHKKDYLKEGIEQLARFVGTIVSESSLYESEPWGFESESLFINQVVVVDTKLSPEELLDIIQEIETKLGRRRIPGVRYSSRTIDIDILFYDDILVCTDRLIIPHPRIQKRNFVLTPLTEILPDFQHPVLRKSIRQLMYECTDRLAVKKLTP